MNIEFIQIHLMCHLRWHFGGDISQAYVTSPVLLWVVAVIILLSPLHSEPAPAVKPGPDRSPPNFHFRKSKTASSPLLASSSFLPG